MTDGFTLRVVGVGRDAECECGLMLYTNRIPTDDEMRAIHDGLRSNAVPADATTLRATVERVQAENARLREAIGWALGEGDSDFAEPDGPYPRYWWRKELRARAALDPQ